MHSPAFIPVAPLTLHRRPRTISLHRREILQRRPPRACQNAPDPIPPEVAPVPSRPAPLARRDQIPALFRGPEAVLGIVLAAAALLADFTRNLVRLAARPHPVLQPVQDIEDSIALLTNALDASKTALADTESRLDESLARASSAETALLGVGDTRDAMRRARETNAEAEAELRRISHLLAEQRERVREVESAKGQTADEREELEGAIREREIQVEELQKRVAEVKASEEDLRKRQEDREEELLSEVQRRQSELDAVRAERLRAEEHASDLEKRASLVAEQAEAAEFALQETRRELQRVQKNLDEKQKERDLVEQESELALQRSVEAEKLQKLVGEMEQELHELQSELRSRDQIVNEVATESDELRSLLAARDAELREVSLRLESALAAEVEAVGDTGRSEMSLNEIKTNLDAEQLALSAEIAKAELASFDISEEDLDPLDRLKREMGAEGDLLQAGLRKAESTVRLEEQSVTRKSDAVDGVLQSIDGEDDKGKNVEAEYVSLPSDGSMSEIAPEADMLSAAASEVLTHEADLRDAAHSQSEPLVVAKQAQSKRASDETKPKKRRGRPAKDSAKTAASDETDPDKPKRKRGRPRKSPA